MKVRIHKGDTVEIISGSADDKGKRAEVIRVEPEDGKVVVSGVNMRTRHKRPVQAQNRQVPAGKVRFEAPISMANVMLVCPKCGKATRVGLSHEGDKVSRRCKKCQALIDD
ncbi:MAG: 50S ribosomal protein L24 [Anaerolineae bacterium]|nr:50S ribosomal protein L24 [Anaerolineae bacterium]